MASSWMTRSVRRSGVVGACVALTAAGCGLILGIEDKGPRAEARAEDCLNGLDDDGDGAIDCEDTDCAAYRCAPAAADGWLGPVTLRLDDGGAGCPKAEQEVLYGGKGAPVIPELECTPCGCTATGEPCEATLRLYDDSLTCGGLSYDTPVSSCTSAEVSGDSTHPWSAEIADVLVAGACLPGGGEPVGAGPPVSFAEMARLCQSAIGAGCGADQGCVPSLESPSAGPCIYHPGEVPCPEGAYVEQHVLDTVDEDGRSCSPCTCDVEVDCTAGTLQLPPLDAGCDATPVCELDLGGGCGEQCALGMGAGTLYARLVLQDPGSCTPGGGQPGGTVSFEKVTVCCMP